MKLIVGDYLFYRQFSVMSNFIPRLHHDCVTQITQRPEQSTTFTPVYESSSRGDYQGDYQNRINGYVDTYFMGFLGLIR
jgi:hypothetical protein